MIQIGLALGPHVGRIEVHADICGRSRHDRKEGNSKIYLEEIGWERMKWLNLSQDGEYYCAVMNREMNYLVP
jgi:hypothetical protein